MLGVGSGAEEERPSGSTLRIPLLLVGSNVVPGVNGEIPESRDGVAVEVVPIGTVAIGVVGVICIGILDDDCDATFNGGMTVSGLSLIHI